MFLSTSPDHTSGRPGRPVGRGQWNPCKSGNLCPKREGEREISRQVLGTVAVGGAVPTADLGGGRGRTHVKQMGLTEYFRAGVKSYKSTCQEL